MYRTSGHHLRLVHMFPNVTHMDLSQCALVNSIQTLSSLPGLKRLDLNWCMGLTPSSLRHLAHLPGLSHLDMSGCAGAVIDDSVRHLAGVSAVLT